LPLLGLLVLCAVLGDEADGCLGGSGYRLYRGGYDVGVKFTDRLARAGKVYVFEGSCTFKTDMGSVHVKAGEYVDLPPGDYEFEVPAESPVRLMNVYHLPELIQR
jgi:hypothetical protein